MRWLFYACLGVVFFTYVGYPTIIWLRSRLRPRTWRRAEILPTVSIIVAVHNGAGWIREQVQHLIAVDYPPQLAELIVVSDGSTDHTVDILRSFAHPRQHLFICDEHRGKAAALNIGIEKASGEILVFVDVRPRLEANALRQLVTNFADRTVGCAGGQLLLRQQNHDEAAAVVSSCYWRYEQWIRKCEAAVDSACGVYGGFYAIRRELAAEVPEGTILDDVYQPLNIVRKGYRSVLDGDARVWDTWPTSCRGEFQRKVRTLAGNFQLLQMAPWVLGSANRLRLQFMAHKLLRLIVPLLLGIMFIATFELRAMPLFKLFLFLQLAFYVFSVLPVGAVAPLRRVRGISRAFCMLNLAVVIAAWKFLFSTKPLWKIWVPVSSAAEHVSALGANQR